MDPPETERIGLRAHHVVAVVLLAAIVFATIVIYGDLPELSRSLRQFPLSYLVIVLALAMGNYLIRCVRWLYYLRTLSVHLAPSRKILVFFSGLSMALSPGKFGELAKCYLLRETDRVPVSQSSPAVIMERVTDIVAVFILSSWGLMALPSRLLIIGSLLVAMVAIILLTTLFFGRDLLLRLPFVRRWETQILDSQESFSRLLTIKAVLIGCSLALLAWLSEGVGLWLVLLGLDSSVSLVHAVSIYATASLVGALTMLPGGIVGTEGSMVGLLRGMNLTPANASAATIIIRLCTLWFAVLVGLTALALFYWLVRPAKPGLTEAPVD